MLIRKRDPAIMFFFKRVFGTARRWIAPHPELLNKMVAFLIGSKLLEGGALRFTDDIDDFLIQPFGVCGIFAGVGLRTRDGRARANWTATHSS